MVPGGMTLCTYSGKVPHPVAVIVFQIPKMMNPQYEHIARGYGIGYEAVTSRENLAAAVQKMLATPGPFILECAIKEDDDVLPMTPPGMNVNDMMLEI